jgi:hypothetical protein
LKFERLAKKVYFCFRSSLSVCFQKWKGRADWRPHNLVASLVHQQQRRGEYFEKAVKIESCLVDYKMFSINRISFGQDKKELNFFS